jgi:hypothetical protein
VKRGGRDRLANRKQLSANRDHGLDGYLSKKAVLLCTLSIDTRSKIERPV